jgi:hypothetical protein
MTAAEPRRRSPRRLNPALLHSGNATAEAIFRRLVRIVSMKRSGRMNIGQCDDQTVDFPSSFSRNSGLFAVRDSAHASVGLFRSTIPVLLHLIPLSIRNFDVPAQFDYSAIVLKTIHRQILAIARIFMPPRGISETGLK